MLNCSFQPDRSDEEGNPEVQTNRRRFLQTLAAGAAAGAVGAMGTSSANAATAKTEAPKQAALRPEDLHEYGPPVLIEGISAADMPTVKFGPYTMSRLITGSNPLEGISHFTRNTANHMREYFTVDRIVSYLQRCEQLGITTWQLEYKDILNEALRIIRDQGSKLQIAHLSADHPLAAPMDKLMEQKPIAIIHHGGVTDRYFEGNEQQKVLDYLKKVKDADAKVLAGVSCHNPNCLKYIEEQGWKEVDFYMGCCYHVTRPMSEIKEKLGTALLEEPFLESDRDEMTATLREMSKPCILFKILAAGRHCWTDRSVEQAFKYAFANIKKTDIVLVGMYPWFKDEIGENVKLAQQYGKLA